MSCATHRLDGGIAMELKIQDSEGNTLETMKR
jgi:hypothetical protein